VPSTNRKTQHFFTSALSHEASVFDLRLQMKMKKRSEEKQTLRARCSKAVPKNFAPPQIPFLGARDGQKLINWRWSLPVPTNPVWLGSTHAISSYRRNRPTHQHTHPHTNRQDRLQYSAPQLSAQCNYRQYVCTSGRVRAY